MIKGEFVSQKVEIKQVFWFQVGDGPNPSSQYDQMGMYTYFGNSTPYYNLVKTDQGIAMKTTTDLLYGKTYDAARTSALNLPSGIEGGAFRGNDGNYVYVLWAKARTDLSENASASFTFPSGLFASSNVTRKEWNFSETNASTTVSKSNIPLNGSPSFFAESGGTSSSGGTTANAGSDQTITLPNSTVVVYGSGTSVGGYITSYNWRQLSGPSQSYIISPLQTSTTIASLVQGIYDFELKVTDNRGVSAMDTVRVTVSGSSGGTTTPSTGTGTTTRIEAEKWSTMSGVATENAWGDPQGGGLIVGWIEQGDWMDYSYNAPAAGSYTVNLRIASAVSGAQFQIKNAGGTVLATVYVPNTGGWQTWQTISTTITLPAGTQTLRLQSSGSAGWNINWWELTSGSSGGTTTPSTGTTTRIEAEKWSTMSGVATENAWGDPQGGGLIVGWIEQGDWMDYSYNAPVAGTYTVNLRIASAVSGAQFQIKNAGGTVLATVYVVEDCKGEII